MIERISDNEGFEYYLQKPENTRIATLDDFHIHGKLKIDMEFLILGYHWQVYQVYKVTNSLTAKFLKPFIDDHRVFILKK